MFSSRRVYRLPVLGMTLRPARTPSQIHIALVLAPEGKARGDHSPPPFMQALYTRPRDTSINGYPVPDSWREYVVIPTRQPGLQ